MFNFFNKIDKENRIGVLKSLDIDNISNGKCFVCSKRINIESLFRNSLVVKDTFITVECLRCRSKGEYNLDTKPEEKLNDDFMIYFADD